MGSRAKTRKLPLAAMIFFVVAVSMLVFLWATTRIASADNGPANWQSFGIDATTTQATANAAANPRGSFEGAGEVTVYEDSVLVSSSSIDISAGIATIEEEERIAEEQRRIAELATIAAAEEARAVYEATAPDAGNLSEVDWSIGEKAFVDEWTARIDAYLAGSPLAGYGATFAQAAWNNHVDPRFSPAISNTESGKGSVCFRPYNAWGWGSTGWSSWEEAINAHVAGLAAGYGYSITPAGAQSYCPPTWQSWYSKTLSQMEII